MSIKKLIEYEYLKTVYSLRMSDQSKKMVTVFW